MSSIFENKYVVFNTSDGPKVILESLNTYGADGWELATMITINEGQYIVAYLKKATLIEAPNPEQTKQNKIAELWSGDEGKE